MYARDLISVSLKQCEARTNPQFRHAPYLRIYFVAGFQVSGLFYFDATIIISGLFF